MKKQKILVLLTESFPFDRKENFLESEINFINGFDQVLIFSCSVVDVNYQRELDDPKIKIFPFLFLQSESNIHKFFRYLNSLFQIPFWQELRHMQKLNRLNLNIFKTSLDFVSFSEQRVKKISKIIKDNVPPNSEIVFYSYWLYYHAYIGTRLKQKFVKSKAISRAHRFDVHEEHRPDSYLPMRSYIFENLDAVYSISDYTKHYLERNYFTGKDNFKVSKLGTIDYGICTVNINRKPLKLVSCSSLIPLKRVHKIIEALKIIQDIEIEWTHFGDGILLEKLCELSKDVSANIKINLKGNVSNPELMSAYMKEDFHLFINVSSIEGVPVSIMEAISFGIPVVATDVGGVSEVVFDGDNGLLLDENFNTEELVAKIKYFAYLENEKYKEFREKAREIWLEKYNAETNYRKFYSDLTRI